MKSVWIVKEAQEVVVEEVVEKEEEAVVVLQEVDQGPHQDARQEGEATIKEIEENQMKTAAALKTQEETVLLQGERMILKEEEEKNQTKEISTQEGNDKFTFL